jgi:hypothetical protein
MVTDTCIGKMPWVANRPLVKPRRRSPWTVSSQLVIWYPSFK